MRIELLLTALSVLTLASCGGTTSSVSRSSSAVGHSTSSVITSSEITEFIFLNQYAYAGLDSRQILEIAYRPYDSSPSPMVLFIHGGSWIGGDKMMMRRYQQQVVDAGYGYVSMNYRLITSGATYLDMLDDIELVIQFLIDFSSNFNVDTTRMAIVGESAGAHLAMLYAYRNVSPIPVEFVMGLVPPVDFTDPGYLSFGNPTVQLSVANALMATSLTGPEDIEINGYPFSWLDASPITHLSNAIPTLIAYAGLDELIPLSNMQRFLLASTTINAPIEAILFPNSNHSLSNDPDKLSELLTTFFIYLNNFLPIVNEASSIFIDI
jgi:acetyl esterase/lipase